MTNIVALGLGLVVATAAVAAAQTPANPRFVSGAGFYNWSTQTSSPTVAVGNLTTETTQVESTTAAGAALGIGTRLRGPFTIRFEWTTEGALTSASMTTSTIGTAPSLLETSTTSETASRRTRAGCVLVGYRLLDRGRATVEIVGGLAIVAERVRSSITDTIVSSLGPAFGETMTTASTATAYRNAPEVGVDIAVRVASRVSAVPAIRAYTVGGIFSVQAGAGVRIAF